MFDREMLIKARAELCRVNKSLRDLHEEEESCKLRRGRLEKESARVKALIDACELAQHLADKPPTDLGYGIVATSTPVFPDRPNGPQFVGISKPHPASIAARRANGEHASPSIVPDRKPRGLPTVAAMVTAALNAMPNGDGLRPRDVLAIVQKQWPGAKYANICSALCRMAQEGALHRSDGHYKLNGHDK